MRLEEAQQQQSRDPLGSYVVELGRSIKGQEKLAKGSRNCFQKENGDVCEMRLD